tara:strand:+ start:649 stop:1866 length:1218 start_codon:yes stop_codon:yes gene_type:complete
MGKVQTLVLLLVAAALVVFEERPIVPLNALTRMVRRQLLRGKRVLLYVRRPLSLIPAFFGRWLRAVRIELIWRLQVFAGLILSRLFGGHQYQWVMAIRRMSLVQGGNTNFPDGLSSRGMPVLPMLRKGDVYHVDSGHTDANATNDGTSPKYPISTVDVAVGKCTASNGDIILISEGHAETLGAAAALDLDVAGITVIGLGNGSNRPTLTLATATTADIDVGAANISLVNVVIDMTGIDAVAAGLDVDAAGFTMEHCRIVISDGTGQAVLGVVGDANADQLKIKDCVFFGSTDAGPTSAIRLNGSEEAEIINCRIIGDFSAAGIEMVTAAPTNLLIEKCDIENYNAVDVGIEGFASATGTIRWCTIRIATDGQVTYINTVGNLNLFENYGVNNNGETGQLIGVVSA